MKTLGFSLKKILELLFCSPIVGKKVFPQSLGGYFFRKLASLVRRSKSCVPILEVGSNIANCRKLFAAELIFDFRPLLLDNINICKNTDVIHLHNKRLGGVLTRPQSVTMSEKNSE